MLWKAGEGGGYIRIGHVQVDDGYAHAIKILKSIGSELDEKQMDNILAYLRIIICSRRGLPANPGHRSTRGGQCHPGKSYPACESNPLLVVLYSEDKIVGVIGKCYAINVDNMLLQ